MSAFEGTPSPPQCGHHKWKPPWATKMAKMKPTFGGDHVAHPKRNALRLLLPTPIIMRRRLISSHFLAWSLFDEQGLDRHEVLQNPGKS